MNRWLMAFLVLAVLAAPIGSAANRLDLTAFARITATGTQPTFLLLWPRETDDAPYTIRDGQDRTSWKTPRHGTHTLTLDFAPLNRFAPHLYQVEAEWEKLPAGRVGLRALDHCGGKVLAEGVWRHPNERFEFDPPVAGYCLELWVDEAGPAALTELHVYAAPRNLPPVIDDAELVGLPASLLRLTWKNRHHVHHVEIHYVPDEMTEITERNLIDMVTSAESWEGPRPAAFNMLAALVPVAEDGTTGEPVYLEAPRREAATLPMNGIIQGMYYTPWSQTEMREMIVRLARAGLSIFMYAPKDDPLHRANWEVPYGEEQMERFFALHEQGKLLGVKVFYSIAPGVTMDTTDPVERQMLANKLWPFVMGGFRHFQLMFDDIDADIGVPVDGTVGAQHADLANWLKDQLEEMAGEPVELWVNPLAKRPEHIEDWPGGADYARAMGETYAEIRLFWGAPTRGDWIDAAYFDLPQELYGRKPVFWDNQFTTDGGNDFAGRVLLSPLQRRMPDFYDGAAGYIGNLMILGAANRLLVTSHGAFMNDPYGYDYASMPPLAAADETTNDFDRELASRLQNVFYGSDDLYTPGMAFPHYREMEAAVAEAKAVLPHADLAAAVNTGRNLLHFAALMATTQNDLLHSRLEPYLVDDLWVPSDRQNHEGHGALFFLAWLGSVMADQPDPRAFRASKELVHRALFDRYWTSPFVVTLMLSYLEDRPPQARGFVAPTMAETPADNPQVGLEWRYEPSTTAEIAVYGLPGAIVVDRQIVWVPSHPGRYHAVVTAGTAAGWSWKILDLTVGGGETDEADDDQADDDPTDPGDDDDKDQDGGCGC